MQSVSVGQEGRLEQVVRAEHGADRFQNSGVTVLATPVLCHWFESAAVLALFLVGQRGFVAGIATSGLK